MEERACADGYSSAQGLLTEVERGIGLWAILVDEICRGTVCGGVVQASF